MNMPNFAIVGFVDPTMLLSTMTLKYGRHFGDNDRPVVLSEPPFQDCQHIMLRSPPMGTPDWLADGDQVDCSLMQEWPSARHMVAAIGAKLTEQIAAPNLQFGRVYLESLRPGGVIGWHADESDYAKAHIRFRTMIAPCAGGCWFAAGIGVDTIAPGVGNVTYFNNQTLHSIINLGPVPQISLITDIRRPRLQ